MSTPRANAELAPPARDKRTLGRPAGPFDVNVPLKTGLKRAEAGEEQALARPDVAESGRRGSVPSGVAECNRAPHIPRSTSPEIRRRVRGPRRRRTQFLSSDWRDRYDRQLLRAPKKVPKSG